MQRKIWKTVLLTLAICSILFNGLLGAALVTDYRHLGQLMQVILLVKGRALPQVATAQLIDGAANGMVAALHDPYSLYLSPDDYARLQNQLNGIFGGVGLILDASNEQKIKVTGVIKDSPAEKAGVQKGDIITAVDGQAVSKIKSAQAADLMKGAIGTFLTITLDKGEGKTQDYRLKRQIINMKSVEAKIVHIPEKVAYVKINSFTDQTGQDLAEMWQGISSAQGIVLDLRDNPGGSLEAAVEVADYFLPKGPVVQLVYRNGRRDSYEVQGNKLHVPVVVLVNKGTASAAEILAAAMQDTSSGLLIGSQTFGKGVVQNIYQIGDNSGLKLTTAKYLSPLGRDINNVGIKPDVAVRDSEDGQAMLNKGLELLAERL